MFSGINKIIPSSGIDRVTGENDHKMTQRANSMNIENGFYRADNSSNRQSNMPYMPYPSTSFTQQPYTQQTQALANDASPDLLPNGCPKFPLKKGFTQNNGAWIAPSRANENYQVNSNNSAWTDHPYQVSKPNQGDRSYEVTDELLPLSIFM